jgi:hypothetical protein
MCRRISIRSSCDGKHRHSLNYEASFRLFLKTPFLRLDNNPAE